MPRTRLGSCARYAGKIGNPFHTKQEKRHSCCNQEGRRGSEEAVPGSEPPGKPLEDSLNQKPLH